MYKVFSVHGSRDTMLVIAESMKEALEIATCRCFHGEKVKAIEDMGLAILSENLKEVEDAPKQ